MIRSIMLIDDEDDCNFVSRLVLGKAGYRGAIITHTSALEALRELRSSGTFPDLMFVDINMPGMSGFDFLAHCENEGLLPNSNTSVVMFSSSNRPVDLERARSYRSVMDYVEKALSVETFQRITNMHFSRTGT